MRVELIATTDKSAAAEYCGGPSWAGVCPAVAPGSPVACAGRMVRVRGKDGGTLLELSVEENATVCPLTALGLAGAGRGEAPQT